MPMIITHTQWIGSFQTGIRYESENPVEEVWSRVARLGAKTELRNGLIASAGADRAAEIARYAALRIRQAVEFREASRGSTTLTAPLTLYYSFLNLARGLLALSTATLPSRGHGLTFTAATDMFDSSATVQSGTFQEYLERNGISIRHGLTFTLRDALARVIELIHDESLPKQIASLAVSVIVDATRGGPLLLRFPDTLNQFRENWQSEFPSLVDLCQLDTEGNVLRVENQDLSTYQAIGRFLSKVLETDLRERETAVWYSVRVVDRELVLPREVYYFGAIFILGSIVRYEPEMMLKASNPDEETGWFLRRFLRLSERYFPQLMLMWLQQRPIYFSRAA